MDFHVVDDETSILQILVTALTKAGYSVQGFGSAKEYLASLQSGELVLPKAIITDVCMPEVDGRQLITSIRKMKPDQRIIIMSGFNDQAFGDGDACIYLTKPFRIPELLKIAETVINCLSDGPSTKHGCASLGSAENFVVTWKCPAPKQDSE